MISYKGAKGENPTCYVCIVEIPQKQEDNYIVFKQPVHQNILQRAKQKLGEPIPDTWGVKVIGDKYIGPNLLGRLLMELRDTGTLEYTLPDDALKFLEFFK